MAGLKPRDRDDPGGTGRLARHLHLGTADRRAARAAGPLTVGAAEPSAFQRRRGRRPAERRRAGHRIGHRLAGPGRLSGPGRHPVRPGPQRPGSRPTRLHPADGGPRRAGTVGVHAGRRLRPAGARRAGRPGDRPAGRGDRAAVSPGRDLPGRQSGRAADRSGGRPAQRLDHARRRRSRLAAATGGPGHAGRPGRGDRRAGHQRRPNPDTRYPAGRHRRAPPRRHRVRPAQRQHLLHLHRDRHHPAG